MWDTTGEGGGPRGTIHNNTQSDVCVGVDTHTHTHTWSEETWIVRAEAAAGNRPYSCLPRGRQSGSYGSQEFSRAKLHLTPSCSYTHLQSPPPNMWSEQNIWICCRRPEPVQHQLTQLDDFIHVTVNVLQNERPQVVVVPAASSTHPAASRL